MESMTKVFLSVPMRGRTKENIKASMEKMKEITRIVLDDPDVMFINTIVEEKPPYGTSNEAIWYLGKSIQLMSQADVLVCVDTPYWLRANGCENEKRIFQDYHNTNCKDLELKYIELPITMVMSSKELKELYNKYEKSCECESPRASACKL